MQGDTVGQGRYIAQRLSQLAVSPGLARALSRAPGGPPKTTSMGDVIRR